MNECTYTVIAGVSQNVVGTTGKYSTDHIHGDL